MLKKIILYIFVFGFLLLFLISFCNKVIIESSSDFIEANNNCDVAIVLGTAKFLSNKRENLFYRKRIQKVVELYRLGKFKYIIVSGDNSFKNYDEPSLMRNDLIHMGVPDSSIYCDYAGFSTIDSMLRMRSIFKQNKFIVVSQRFHVERAIYLARRNGIEAYGECADNVPFTYAPYNHYREKLARVKAVFDALIGIGSFYEGTPVFVIKT
jgi:SanA protein